MNWFIGRCEMVEIEDVKLQTFTTFIGQQNNVLCRIQMLLKNLTTLKWSGRLYVFEKS